MNLSTSICLRLCNSAQTFHFHIFWCFTYFKRPICSSNWYLEKLIRNKDLNLVYFKKDYFLLYSQVRICCRALFMNRFYFFLLKTDHFWNFNTFSKNWKLKGEFSYNLEQNIYRIFPILAQFLFTISEMELDYYRRNVNVQVASRVTEWLETLGN